MKRVKYPTNESWAAALLINLEVPVCDVTIKNVFEYYGTDVIETARARANSI